MTPTPPSVRTLCTIEIHTLADAAQSAARTILSGLSAREHPIPGTPADEKFRDLVNEAMRIIAREITNRGTLRVVIGGEKLELL